MKTVVTMLMAVAVLVLLAVPAVADWKEGDPYKWYQPPDLTDTGIDIYNVCPKILADDFLCTSPIPITDVHFWGSWKDDEVGQILSIILSIHSNVPADDQIPWSRPGELLWQRDFEPAQFEVIGPIDSPEEDWMNTNTGEYIPDNHNFAWQINIPKIDDPFLQEGTPDRPIIYWLDVTRSKYNLYIICKCVQICEVYCIFNIRVRFSDGRIFPFGSDSIYSILRVIL